MEDTKKKNSTVLTDEEVEAEIARLTKSEAVKLARKELRNKYRRRQQLYTLRALEKRGEELLDAGITLEMLSILGRTPDDIELDELEEIIKH